MAVFVDACQTLYLIPFSHFTTFMRNTGMDMISLEGKTNFFEKRVAEYQKSGVMASLEESSNLGSKSLNFDAEF